MRKAVMFAALAVLFLGGATFAMADHGGRDRKADCKSRHFKKFDKVLNLFLICERFRALTKFGGPLLSL